MKGNIGNAIKSLANPPVFSELIEPSRWRNGNFFFGVNGADKAFIWGNWNSSLIAYQHCPVVSSVINRQAQATINGVRKIMDKDNKESDLPLALAIKKLLDRPNPLQNGMEFRAQGGVYRRIYGYNPVLIVKPVGFEKDPSSWRLWNLPPWMIVVRDSMELFFTNGAKPFQSITLSYMGHTVDLTMDAVFFIKENQIATSIFQYNGEVQNASMWLPDSRLHPLEKPIDNIIASLNSRGSLTTNRGPQWILTNDNNDNPEAGAFPVDPEYREKLQKDFLQYGIMDGQRKAIITDARLKLQTVGFDVAQLKLLEGEIQDAKLICDGLNFPPYLLGLVDAKFDNQQIAERSNYTNSIIPDANSEDEQLTVRLGLDIAGLKIVTDYSHLPALQENIAEKGRGLFYMNQGLQIQWVNNLLTWNEWRLQLGMDPTAEAFGDMYYFQLVAEGWTFGAAAGPLKTLAENNSQSPNSNSNENESGT